MDGEEEEAAELQGATESALTVLGLGSCGDGIVLDAMGDREREETGGAMAAAARAGWLLGFILKLWLQVQGAQGGRSL